MSRALRLAGCVGAVFLWSTPVLAGIACSEKLGIRIPLDTERYSVETEGPASLVPESLSGEDCRFQPCLKFSELKPSGMKRSCQAVALQNLRSAFHFFVTPLQAQGPNPAGGRTIQSQSSLVLSPGGALEATKPGVYAEALHNGRWWLVIDATIDLSAGGRALQRGEQLPDVKETTVIRFHPKKDTWLRFSCFDFAADATARDEFLALSAALEFVEACP